MTELRENLICKLQRGDDLFPGVVGYEDTVVPQIVNAVLSRHNFILLGLRGQAKTRIIRMLTGCWTNICLTWPAAKSAIIRFIPSAAAAAIWSPSKGETTPIAWLDRDQRYVEKLATPDVTIADMIGDIDPIKAARGGHEFPTR
jgi:magnesium chelatase subunit I